MHDWTNDAHRQDHAGRLLAESSPTEIADYVKEMTAELAQLARGSGLDLLAYLLDIVHLEATMTSRKISPTGV